MHAGESTGNARDAAAPKATEKAGDDESKAAAEAEAAPKPVVKPRRDRKGRIRGTHGINAKPVAVETPEVRPSYNCAVAKLRQRASCPFFSRFKQSSHHGHVLMSNESESWPAVLTGRRSAQI
ncbi:MAG: hypothetical protein FRX49_03140 [Trebouxia sp. A1-2]|nr:MAG: hypothetical protein FRX49_03140 [Trebouxia sp. A1-2]